MSVSVLRLIQVLSVSMPKCVKSSAKMADSSKNQAEYVHVSAQLIGKGKLALKL